MTATFIFNQYYIDFLKRIKDVAKKNKETNENAKPILKAIKDNYLTLDKASDEYVLYIKEQITEEGWDKYIENDKQWLEDNTKTELYKGIAIADILNILQDDYLFNHFLSIFYIFMNDLNDEESANIVKILQTVDANDAIDALTNDKIKSVLTRLQEHRNKKIKDKSGLDMNFIEETTLGRLAKEILQDIDVGKLQKSMGENGDVLKAIGDPDSGFADILTNVSKKMANKISNGELKQENLIQDAMKFASVMPNLFGGKGKGHKKNNDMPDLSNIMNMMSSMMGNAGNGDGDDFANILKSMNKGTRGNSHRAPHGTKRTVNDNALKKIAKAKKLKKKLHEKKKAEAQADTTKDDVTTVEN